MEINSTNILDLKFCKQNVWQNGLFALSGVTEETGFQLTGPVDGNSLTPWTWSLFIVSFFVDSKAAIQAIASNKQATSQIVNEARKTTKLL